MADEPGPTQFDTSKAAEKRKTTNGPDFVPDAGEFAWELREKVPGIDEAAVKWRAEFEGYTPNGEADPAGSLREFMGRAIATAHDRVAVARMNRAMGGILDLRHHLGEIEALLAFGWAATERLRALVPLLWAYSPYLPADALAKVRAVVGDEIGLEFPGGENVEDTAGEPVFPPGDAPLGMMPVAKAYTPTIPPSRGGWVVLVGVSDYLAHDPAADCLRLVKIDRAHRWLTETEAKEVAAMYRGTAVWRKESVS